jgi:hypothetical protein
MGGQDPYRDEQRQNDGFRRNLTGLGVARNILNNEEDELIKKLNDLEAYVTSNKPQNSQQF